VTADDPRRGFEEMRAGDALLAALPPKHAVAAWVADIVSPSQMLDASIADSSSGTTLPHNRRGI
jgi:hypothetical protein